MRQHRAVRPRVVTNLHRLAHRAVPLLNRVLLHPILERRLVHQNRRAPRRLRHARARPSIAAVYKLPTLAALCTRRVGLHRQRECVRAVNDGGGYHPSQTQRRARVSHVPKRVAPIELTLLGPFTVLVDPFTVLGPLGVRGGATVHEPRVKRLHRVVRVEKPSEVFGPDDDDRVRLRPVARQRPPPGQYRRQPDVVIGVDVRDPHALQSANYVIRSLRTHAPHELTEGSLAGVHKHGPFRLLVQHDAGHVAVLGGRRRAGAEEQNLRVALLHRGQARGDVELGIRAALVSSAEFRDSRRLSVGHKFPERGGI